jgi:site-specific DNA recombinase
VWNRQRRDEVLIDVEDVALGHETKMRWNEPAAWVWSEHETHPTLVPIEDFDAAQTIFSGAQRAAVRREHTRHPYLLSGRMSCAICGRKMQGSWNNGKPYYRCKFPAEYAVAAEKHDRTVYVREGSVVPGLDEWLAGLFDDEHLDATCAALAEASQLSDDDPEVVELDLRRRLKECENKLTRYRDVLEGGTQASVIGEWIAEVDRERRSIERQLGHKPTNQVLTASEVKALVTRLRDIVAVLANADPELKRTVYEELGVRLTYHPSGEVHVEAGDPHVLGVRVGGGT